MEPAGTRAAAPRAPTTARVWRAWRVYRASQPSQSWLTSRSWRTCDLRRFSWTSPSSWASEPSRAWPPSSAPAWPAPQVRCASGSGRPPSAQRQPVVISKPATTSRSCCLMRWRGPPSRPPPMAVRRVRESPEVLALKQAHEPRSGLPDRLPDRPPARFPEPPARPSCAGCESSCSTPPPQERRSGARDAANRGSIIPDRSARSTMDSMQRRKPARGAARRATRTARSARMADSSPRPGLPDPRARRACTTRAWCRVRRGAMNVRRRSRPESAEDPTIAGV